MRFTLDELGSADVVYALRMQHERMSESWVPSLREYAAWYQINGRRLSPRQVLMHPGPVNRGVELSGEVVDSPQAVITAQVEAGVVVRMAVLYELLAARRPRSGAPPRRTDAGASRGARGRGMGPSRASTGRAPADLLSCATCTCSIRARGRRPPRRARPRRRDRRARRARDAPNDPARESVEGGRGPPDLLPAFFDPHVHLRTPGQEHKEDLETGTARPPPAASAR